MRRIFTLTMTLVCVMGVAAQVYTSECNDKKVARTAAKWVKKGAWRHGFTANPHESVNAVEFYTQYQKNTAQWDAAFEWLATHDLLTIPAGKHEIEGTTLVVSVEDSENGELSKRRSESHYNHIDFQLVVKGTERFGIIDHETSTPNSKYRPDVIHYDYDASKALFYDSTLEEFFLFFPCDWHIAKINNDTDDQTIRVIVIKLDYLSPQ